MRPQVATRRTRTAGKVEIPNVDDHVSKLEHMGKETVKKLQDVHASAIGCGIDIDVPTNCVNKGDTRGPKKAASPSASTAQIVTQRSLSTICRPQCTACDPEEAENVSFMLAKSPVILDCMTNPWFSPVSIPESRFENGNRPLQLSLQRSTTASGPAAATGRQCGAMQLGSSGSWPCWRRATGTSGRSFSRRALMPAVGGDGNIHFATT